VFSRVRPLIGDETFGNGGEIAHIHFPDDDRCTMELERLADANPNEVPVVDHFIFLFICILQIHPPSHYTESATHGNTRNLLEFLIPPGNTGNMLEFRWSSWKFSADRTITMISSQNI